MLETRAAIIDALAAQNSIINALGQTSNSLLNESDMTQAIQQYGDALFPAIIIKSGGRRPIGAHEFLYEFIDVYVYDRDNAYYRIESILSQVELLFDRQSLNVAAGATGAIIEVAFMHESASYFDHFYECDFKYNRFMVNITRNNWP